MIKLACMEDPKCEDNGFNGQFLRMCIDIICLGCAEDIYTAVFSLHYAWV